jgi:hypothetical protein
MTTLTKQQIKADWKIMADYPIRDGDYVVVFPTDTGYGDLDIWSFNHGVWEPLFGYTPDGEPAFWIDLPFPK